VQTDHVVITAYNKRCWFEWLFLECGEWIILPKENSRDIFFGRGGILRFQNGNYRWPWFAFGVAITGYTVTWESISRVKVYSIHNRSFRRRESLFCVPVGPKIVRITHAVYIAVHRAEIYNKKTMPGGVTHVVSSIRPSTRRSKMRPTSFIHCCAPRRDVTRLLLLLLLLLRRHGKCGWIIRFRGPETGTDPWDNNPRIYNPHLFHGKRFARQSSFERHWTWRFIYFVSPWSA